MSDNYFDVICCLRGKLPRVLFVRLWEPAEAILKAMETVEQIS